MKPLLLRRLNLKFRFSVNNVPLSKCYCVSHQPSDAHRCLYKLCECNGLQAMGVSAGVRHQRKEVGITAYKKPGPPTPSKQAGRLSATVSLFTLSYILITVHVDADLKNVTIRYS